MLWVKWIVIVVAALAVLLIVAGQAGLLTGTAPADLGVRDGRLKGLSSTPNCVSSQAGLYPDHPQRAYADIAPLALRDDGPATLAAVRAVVEGMEGAVVVTSRGDYLYARFTTKLLKFVDDVEFWVDPAAQAVQVRSASRIGYSDRGVNRARVEAIRSLLATR
jgi:uncharacterized protein (DUF1499 family)